MADDKPDNEDQPTPNEAPSEESAVNEAATKSDDAEKSDGAENPNVSETDNGPKSTDPDDVVDLDMDDDLADALGDDEAAGDEAIDVDQALSEADPDFENELNDISSTDFQGVVIAKDAVSDEVPENAKIPSAYRSFIKNLPQDVKNRYLWAAGVLAVLLPFALLIYMGKILPEFGLPYAVRMDEISRDIHSYPEDGVSVPLFDDFRTKAFTVTLPKATINLKSTGGRASYGEFEFFINLRDEESKQLVEDNKSEILDLMQRVLEEVTWKELQNPIGKEKVKKVIRYHLNEYFKGNVVIGVYYRSVILNK